MQPPPGYSQGPQQGQPQGQPQNYQQPGQPQYGMQQMPYQPPRKKGLPGWAWGLIIGALVLFCGFPLLAILAIPLITSNTRDARRAEGEQMMGFARNSARIEYSKTASNPGTFSSFADPADFAGKYFRVEDQIRSKSEAAAEITCVPQQTTSDGKGRLEFDWSHGMGKTTWED